jgi:hypothetical protein
VISKISLNQAASAASAGRLNGTGIVDVVQVDSTPMVMNPNGEHVWPIEQCPQN